MIRKAVWIAWAVCFSGGILSAQTYDVTADFSTNSNPNGVWSYGSLDIGFVNYAESSWYAGWEAWTAADHSANVWVNDSGSHQYGINDGEVALHPGSGGQPAVIRWTAPEDIDFAQIRIAGEFGAGDQYAPSLSIRQDTAILWSGIDSGSFDETISVAAGDTIDFCVYGESSYANTSLDVTITVLKQVTYTTLDDFDRYFARTEWTTVPGLGGFAERLEGAPATNWWAVADDNYGNAKAEYRSLPFLISTNSSMMSIQHFSKIGSPATGAYGVSGLRLADHSITTGDTRVVEWAMAGNKPYGEPADQHVYFIDGAGTKTISSNFFWSVDVPFEFRADMDWRYVDGEGKYGLFSLYYKEDGATTWSGVAGLQRIEMNVDDPSVISSLCGIVHNRPGYGYFPQLDDIRYCSGENANLGEGVNLLLEPDFTKSITPWRTDGEGQSRIDTSYGHAFDGVYVYTESSSTVQVYQAVNLLSQGISPEDIDAGTCRVAFGGTQYSSGSSAGQIKAVFLNGGDVPISTNSLPVDTDSPVWTEYMATNIVPAQTRSIRYDFFTTYGACLDDAYLSILGHPQEDVILSVSSAHGSPLPAIGTLSNNWGTVVTCSVQNVTSGTTQYECIGWTGTGSVPTLGNSNAVEVTLTEDSSITWNWQTNYWLDISVSGSGSVDVVDGFYAKDSEQILTATPDSGWLFMGWSGDASGTNSEAFVFMTEAQSVTASFSDDADGDGLLNSNETAIGSNPWKSDTDDDGFDDKTEVDYGLSPTADSSGLVTYIQNNDDAFGLYSSNAVLDVSVGQVLFNVSGATAALNLQLESSDDLVTWTNAGDAVEWNLSVDGEKKFFRVRTGK